MAASALVPKDFQGNLPNCVIGLEMAARIGASPLAVLQNLYIVHGRPSWSSQFIIAAVNSSGKFSPIRFEMTGEGDKKQCVAWALELATNTRLDSPPISIDMAKKEGWYSKNGSKWQTMPDLMLRYRAATLFGRLYAPEILMGMKTYEEMIDIGGVEEHLTVIEPEPVKPAVAVALKEKLDTKAKKEKVVEVVPENVSTETSEILDEPVSADADLFT
jgi:hypothetical protein